MYAPFKNSPTVKALERAYDLVHIGKTTPNPTEQSTSRKRSRNFMEQEVDDTIFKEVVQELDYAELFPTFRTLVLERFYLLLSYNTTHEYFEHICKIIDAFKHIIYNADRLYYSTDENDKKELYYYLTDELKRLLYNSQQIILLFHLSAQSP
jgi:hypothetical protein